MNELNERKWSVRYSFYPVLHSCAYSSSQLANSRLKRTGRKIFTNTLEMEVPIGRNCQICEQICCRLLYITQVPDYLEFVSEPMDFTTMREKLEAHKYCSVADLEADFNLMVSNCLRYNASETVFHKAAMQLKEVGGAILRHAQQQALSTGLDNSTGMHLPDSKANSIQSCWEKGE